MGGGTMALPGGTVPLVHLDIYFDIRPRTRGDLVVPWIRPGVSVHVATGKTDEPAAPEYKRLGGARLDDQSALSLALTTYSGLDIHPFRTPFLSVGPVLGVRMRTMSWSQGDLLSSSNADVGFDYGVRVRARPTDPPGRDNSSWLVAEAGLLRRSLQGMEATYFQVETRLASYLLVWLEAPLQAYRPLPSAEVATSLLGSNSFRTTLGVGLVLPL
jgi:hypothetical protein